MIEQTHASFGRQNLRFQLNHIFHTISLLTKPICKWIDMNGKLYEKTSIECRRLAVVGIER